MTTCTHCGIKSPNITAHYEVAHRQQEETLEAAKKERDSQATNDVLLFFEEIPESAKVYQLKVTSDELVKLTELHDNLLDSKNEENYRWIRKLLADKPEVYNTGNSNASVLNLNGSFTLICTGLTQEATFQDEDEALEEDLVEDSLDEESEETSTLPTDFKAYYFHAQVDDEALDPTTSSLVCVTPKDHFDKNDCVPDEWVSDYLDLGLKFEEIDHSLFVFDGPVHEANVLLTALGMTLNSKIVEE